MKKRVASVILVLCMLAPFLPVRARAADTYSGSCGSDLTWTYYYDEKQIIIEGKGEMKNFTTYGSDISPFSHSVKSVIIKKGVTSIGDNAFYACTDLTSITIPESVTRIGSCAFYGCTALSTITLPTNLAYIGYSVFQGCAGLTSIKIPDKVNGVSNSMFSGCTSLTTAILSSNSTNIGQYAFSGCSSLTSVNIPDGVTEIGQRAFNGCSSLAAIEIPGGVEIIESGAFSGCSSLITVTLPHDLWKINSSIFADCSNLTEVHIPKDITSICIDAFSNCPKLSNVYYAGTEEDYKKIDNFYISPNGNAVACSPDDPNSDPFSGNVEIHYAGDIHTHTVTFSGTFASGVTDISAPKVATCGDTIDQPNDPVCIGYRFMGWYRTNDIYATDKWNFDTSKVTKDITLYAKWEEEKYTVRFDSNGGFFSTATGLYKEVTGVTHWTELSAPDPAPTKSGYTLNGWYKDKGCTQIWDFKNDRMSESATLYAGWTAVTATYTITFDSQGGDAVSSATVNNGGKVTKPADPDKTGHTFGGWYKEASCTNAWNFDTDTVTSDITLYAKWTPISYTVRFDLNGTGATGSFSDQSIAYGQKISAPTTEPGCTGHTFDGWYKEAGCTNAWNFDTDTVTEDTTLYAKWTPISYTVWTVRFHSQSGTEVPSATVNDGDKVTEPTAPTFAGYTFLGWFKAADGTDKWDFNMPVTENINLFAHWKRNEYTVNFITGVDTIIIDDQTISYQQKVVKPNDPSRTDYTFGGWYEEAACTTPWNFNNTVTSDITLYAKWTENAPPEKVEYTVTFDTDGGSAVPYQTVPSGGKATTPPEPTREKYTFAGWFTEKDDGQAWNFDTVIQKDTTIYAHWTPDPDTPAQPKTYTITFNPNGGTVSPTSAETNTDGKVTMPTPTRGGYTFDGWYTNASGGTKVDSGSTFTASATVYAHWTQTPATPTETRYRIYTPGGVSGGSYDVSHSSAAEDTRVTIEFTPRSGYELDRLTVTNLDTGRSVSLTERYSDEYYFTMPASSVEVDISFSRVYPGNVYFDVIPPRAKPGPTAWYYMNRHIYHVTDGQVPDSAPITRDMLISVLYNLTDENLLDTPSDIGSETNNSHTWAVSNGIIPDIYASGLWGLDKALSREQLALMVFQYAKYAGRSTAQSAAISYYSDYSQVRPIARGAMSWTMATGLMDGATLSPWAGVTCGQTGELLYRFQTTIP